MKTKKTKSNKRGNPQNLIVRTGEEARELGRKGGIASGITRKARHAFADVLRTALNTPIPMTSDKERQWTRLLERFGICDMTAQNLIICSLLDSAIKGDIRAATFIRDTLMMSTGGIESVGNLFEEEPTTLEGKVRHELYQHLADHEIERAYREVIEPDDRKENHCFNTLRLELANSIKAESRRDMIFGSGGETDMYGTQGEEATSHTTAP